MVHSHREGEIGLTFHSTAPLKQLEDVGFSPCPMSLVRWDQWRPGIEPGAVSDIPETKHQYRRTEVSPIAPVFVRVNPYTGGSLTTFYRGHDNTLLRVNCYFKTQASVGINEVRDHRGRVTHYSPWMFLPEHWGRLEFDDQVIALGNPRTHMLNKQVDGDVYWTLLGDTDQGSFPLTPAEIASHLERVEQ